MDTRRLAIRLSSLIRAAALLAVAATSQRLMAQDLQPVRSVEGITEYHLENGLQVLLFPDESSPKVTVNLTVFVGSRHEGYGEAGMAHLLEHMLYKGTPTFPRIPAELQKRGADYNGTTWLDRTNYYETMPASDENLDFALRLEADRIVNSFIKAEDLASEMTVVRSEFERGENSPQRILMQRIMAAAFEWHNYGKTTIGNRADIERVPVASLRRFYERFYQPDNAMLVVAGKFDPAMALGLVQKYFGALPKPERELDRTYTEEPAQDGERLVTLRRVGDVPMAGVQYHIPSGAHPDFAVADVLTSVMTTEPGGRLYDRLVTRKVAAAQYGISFGLHDPGVILFLADGAQGIDAPTLLQNLVEAVETAAESPFTAEEVDRAKSELLKQRELQMADAQAVAIELSEWAAQGDWRLFFLHRDRLEAVTPDDVTRVAKAYLIRANRTAGMFDPTKEPERATIPATPDVAELLKDYKGRTAVAQGEAFDSSPLAIEARLQRSKLASGMKVTLLPKKTRGAQVTLRINLRYGNPDALKGMATATTMLPEMLNRGTENMTRQQINDQLNNYRAQMSVSGSPGVLSVTVQTTRENLLPVLGLVEEVLRHPKFPAEELEVVREEQLSLLNQQFSDPGALAFLSLSKKLAPYEPDDARYVPSIEEGIE
ncbi:MAG: insulinase family protein, partial [Planctomycetaceae bacterium]|nr:insulinase family protein [Planctomycetaceae bacterium]